MLTLSVVLVLLMALDTLTTGLGLEKGIAETNPLFSVFPTSFMFSGKFVVGCLVFIVGWLFERGQGNSLKWGRALYLGLILVHVLVVWNNLAALTEASTPTPTPSARPTETPIYPPRPTLTPSPTIPPYDFPEEPPMTAHCDGVLALGKYCEVRIYPWTEDAILMVSVSSSYRFVWWREWPYGQAVYTPLVSVVGSAGLEPWGFDFLTVRLPCSNFELVRVSLYDLAYDKDPIMVETLGSDCQVIPLVSRE